MFVLKKTYKRDTQQLAETANNFRFKYEQELKARLQLNESYEAVQYAKNMLTKEYNELRVLLSQKEDIIRSLQINTNEKDNEINIDPENILTNRPDTDPGMH